MSGDAYGDPGYMREETEQASTQDSFMVLASAPASMFLPWVLSLAFLSGLCLGLCKSNKPVPSSQVVWSWCFITATAGKVRHQLKHGSTERFHLPMLVAHSHLFISLVAGPSQRRSRVSTRLLQRRNNKFVKYHENSWLSIYWHLTRFPYESLVCKISRLFPHYF